MKFIPVAVTQKVGLTLLKTQKHSPTLLFVGGMAGFVGTVVLASRATLKLEEVVSNAESNLKIANTLADSDRKDYTDEDAKKDKTIIYVQTVGSVVKLYAPAIVVGGLTVLCLTKSHNILTKRNAAVTAAYAALDKGFREYRARVVGEIGEEREKHIRYGWETREIVEETPKGPKVKDVVRVGPNGASIYARFFDNLCSSWQPQPLLNRTFLQMQEQYANDKLRIKGHVFLNEVYDSLGFERTKEGAVVGWLYNPKNGGDGYIDFGLFDQENRPVRNASVRDFVNGREGSILLDFNVDGIIYDQI